ncbi:PREDICTED: LOW QUALITY PROTEIN: caprin homolog [Dufourea novaeangliae]|uniref:LOW QUALITY PROTEIN: caprin homolog n=1 Tax=Dufourea novaeangliae TaxID=178035 RepID=UPI0007672B5B|nr:PREDICTED: LOW QUALITY PROTEIN: caprin homolog [Dufourea novaeangliae]
MPSANPKLEKQASTETVEPIRQAIIVIEHKIRNLEKRKVKLESYKDLQKNGRELNTDQKTAVAKYDEVLQTLDITRELYKQILGIAQEAVKQQKKMARKEAIERMQQDIAKVREVLLIQDALMNMGTDSIREDFLTGKNGAVKLSEEDLKYLDSLYNEVMTKHHREGEPTFLQQVQKVAEHYVAIVDGKQREVVGTTYNKLKEIINSINQCGYFDQVREVETAVEVTEAIAETQVSEIPAQEQISEEYSSSERHIPPESMIPIPNFPVQVAPLPVVSGTAPVSGPIPVVAQPIPPHPAAPVETSYYTNATGFIPQPQQQQQQQSQQTQQQPPQAPRINDVIGTPNFFFLQESELDSPDVTSQAPIVSHQPVIYQHQPPQDMSHIPGFANPNPPPPIPMPPSHQQPNMQYSPQHPANFQQQPQQQTPSQQIPQQTQTQNFEHQQENQQTTEEKTEENQDETIAPESELEQPNEPVDWCQITDANDWNQVDQSQQPTQDSQQEQQQQQQTSQQAWGDQQRSGYKGRGGKRGNSNGYNGRGRGSGYQQNGRGGQGTYYRNDSNYQNGYQQRSWGNNEGNGGYNSGYKRGGGGPRGGPRGERGMDRGSRGQFRGQRGGNRGGYTPRGKPHAQQ